MATFNDGEQRSSIRTKINASITKTDAMDQGVATTDDVEFASVNGRDVAADGSKLDGIEAGATADQTAGEIKTAYESNADTNAFTDAEQSKLSGIEAGADVTDTTNVTAAGALMDSELTSEASVKGLDQGVATTDSPEFAGLTVDTDTLYVDSAGNRVGIGTSSPSGALHVSGGISRFTNTTTNWLDIDASSGAGNDVKLSNRFNSLIFSANSGAGAPTIRFNTNGSEAMRIDSSGNVLVGKTSSDQNTAGHQIFSSGTAWHTADGTFPLFLNRTTNDGELVRFRQDGVTVGTISVSGSTTSYNTTSDERLKENITDADDASAVIDGIQVRQFDWKADGEHQRYGMIAQELDTVAPEAVTKGETEDDMWAVDYSKLVPMLVKEIQDLRKRVAELEGAN